MVKKKWYAQIGNDRIEVIECLDSGNKRVWIKFEPVDKTKQMEVCNIVDQTSQVSWAFKNSHFETISGRAKTNYYQASTAGSFRVDAGASEVFKDSGSKVVLFPLDLSGSISVYNYALASKQFKIVANKPMWIGYAISGSGTLTVQ